MGAGRWGRATRSGRWSPGRAGQVRGPCAGSEGGVSWAERRVTGPRRGRGRRGACAGWRAGGSGPLWGSAGPSGERELGPRGIQLGQGLGLGFQGRWDWAWVEGWAAGLV